MTEPAAVSESEWRFWTALAPYIGQALVAIVAALVGAGGMWATQKLSAPKPAMVISAADKDKTAPVTERAFVTAFEVFSKRFDMLDGATGLCVTEVQALRGERTDKTLPVAPVVKAWPRPKPIPKSLFDGLPAPFGK